MPTITRVNPLSYLGDQLAELKQKGTYSACGARRRAGAVCTFDGRRVINLASNNYLG